jgi:calreticulin
MAGEWNHTSGRWNGDVEVKGKFKTLEEWLFQFTSYSIRFYAISTEYPKFSNKNNTLVL